MVLNEVNGTSMDIVVLIQLRVLLRKEDVDENF